LLSLLHRFPLCPEQNIYRNIALLKSLWNYLSNVWSFIESVVQTRELCPFLLQHCVLSKTDFSTCCTRWFGHNRL
jgi:hypothetical protein